METLRNALYEYPMLSTALQVSALLVAVWAVDAVSRQVLLRLAIGVMRRSEVKWDDALIERRAIHHALRLPPALAAYYGITLAQGLPPGAVTVIRNVLVAYAVVTIARALMAALWAVNDRYELRPQARSRPATSRSPRCCWSSSPASWWSRCSSSSRPCSCSRASAR